jgi:RNA recognition motif-containing protein
MTTADHLAALFLPFGVVKLSRIAKDSTTGRSLGFGFIELETASAKFAIGKLNRFLFMNSYMEVKEVAI